MTDNKTNAENLDAESEECPCVPPAMLNMECVERVKKLALVEAALTQSTQIYNNVKSYSPVLTWTLDTAESTVNRVVEQTLPVVAPIVKKLETPIGMVDKTLCKGLDAVENAVPCINQEPAEIRDNAKKRADTAYQQVKSLQELSWITANEFLKSPVGNVIMESFENLVVTTDKILDFILPPGEPLAVPRAEKVVQALTTIAGLPNRAARHAYNAISSVIRTAGKQDIRENIRNLLTFLQLQHLQHLVAPACESEPESSGTVSPPRHDTPQNSLEIALPKPPKSARIRPRYKKNVE